MSLGTILVIILSTHYPRNSPAEHGWRARPLRSLLGRLCFGFSPSSSFARTTFLSGVDHRQDPRCCAMIKRRCFKEVRCVRVAQLAKAWVRVHALGSRLHVNWRATFIALFCRRISFGWRRDGPP